MNFHFNIYKAVKPALLSSLLMVLASCGSSDDPDTVRTSSSQLSSVASSVIIRSTSSSVESALSSLPESSSSAVSSSIESSLSSSSSTSVVSASSSFPGSFSSSSVESFFVTTSVVGEGTVSPTFKQVITGNITDFTIQPKSGASINSVTGCSGSLLDRVYTTGVITETCEVVANFSLQDACPADALKIEPGVCGCGVADVDSDNNGTMDCLAKPGVTNLRQYLEVSDGSHGLGNTSLVFNNVRDKGSKIVYFDSSFGNNSTADYYWWDGTNIVDSSGNIANPDNNEVYGTDPLNPNELAINPFAELLAANDDRLRTQAGSAAPRQWRFDGLAGGYPDWFLYRRGQKHTKFDWIFVGGKSESEPMVVAAYGPLSDGRAIMEPGAGSKNPFSAHNWGLPQNWFHQVLYSLEIRAHYGYVQSHTSESYAGGPVTAFIEDCYWPNINGGVITYPPHKTTIRRSIIANSWKDPANGHNQAYYTSDFLNKVTFDEVIFYKNGFGTNPLTNADPSRTIYSRNIYQGGGAKMGHTYRNIISMDGASGGPQMRFGGLMENSLIVEGYFYSSTMSNSPKNDWLESGGQSGVSAIVRNNVQLVYGYPTPMDPDSADASDSRSQPKWGYILEGASFGAVVENNIISGAMLADDLGSDAYFGINVKMKPETYQNGASYTQLNNTIRNNIIYRVNKGLHIEGDAAGVSNVSITNNVIVSDDAIYERNTENLISAAQLLIDDNRFYTDDTLQNENWVGSNNTVNTKANAATIEGWLDPDRTLKRYVQEVLGLTLVSNDPAGMKTFMTVAIHMRYGGTDAIPSSGIPSASGDYPWDERYTGIAVVNWIRAGFGLPAAE